MVSSSFSEQVRAAREGAGLYVAESWGHFRVEGVDAVPFLHRLTTNDLLQTPAGEGRHHALLDRQGKVRSLFFLLTISETCLHGFAPQIAMRKAFEILANSIFADRVTIRDVSNDYSLLLLVGPKAPHLRDTLSWQENHYRAPVCASLCPRTEAARLIAELSTSTFPVTKEVLDLLRLEVGIPEYGVDIDEHNILLEGKLHHTYARRKGCYPGQEVIERLHTYANGRTPKVIASFPLRSEQDIVLQTAIVTANGEHLGTVSSTSIDPLQKRTWAMATFNRKAIEGATHLEQRGEQLTLCFEPVSTSNSPALDRR